MRHPFLRQPQLAHRYADSVAGRRQMLLSQENPILRERMRMIHGRYLSGLGGESPDGEAGYAQTYQDQGGYDLEAQDDTYGSGIFDPSGRPGTANTNMGILASHYSLPGYIAREVPFTVSRDVTDITDDAEVVTIPAGGLAVVEHRGKLTRPAITGPTWVPPRIQPAGNTERYQPYAFMTRPGQAPPPALNPNAPVTGPPQLQPGRMPFSWERPLRTNVPSCRVPTSPQQMTIARRSAVEPDVLSIATSPPQPCQGMGQDKEPASAGKVLFAGAIVGTALGLVALTVSGAPARRRAKGRR